MKTCLKVRLTFFDMHKCLSTPWQVAVDHVTHSYDSYWNHFCSSSLISFLISPCFVAEISILVNHLPEYFLQLSPKGRIPCIPNLTGLDQDKVSRAPKEGIRKQQKQLLPASHSPPLPLPASHFPLPASSFGPRFRCLCLEAESAKMDRWYSGTELRGAENLCTGGGKNRG